MSGAAELGQLGSVVTVDANGNTGLATTPVSGFRLAVGAGAGAGNSLHIGGNGITLGFDYAAYLMNSYYDGAAWRYNGNGYAFGIGQNFGGPTGGLTIATSGNNVSGAAAALTWIPRFAVDVNGTFGYTTGTGGTVTQITNKFTGVTLNKPCGNVLTSNAVLAAGVTATFTLTNSNIAAADVVIVNPTNGNYRAKANNNSAGSCTISLTNESGGSLSDAVQIQFAIIKAAAS